MKTCAVIALVISLCVSIVAVQGGAMAASGADDARADLVDGGVFHQSSPCNSAVMDCSGG